MSDDPVLRHLVRLAQGGNSTEMMGYLTEVAQKSHPYLRAMLIEIFKLPPAQKNQIYDEALKQVGDDEMDRLIAGEHDEGEDFYAEDFYCFKTSTTMGAIFSCLALPKPAMNRDAQVLHCNAAMKFLDELVTHSMNAPSDHGRHTNIDRLFCALPLKSLAEYANFCRTNNFYDPHLDDQTMGIICPLLEKNNEMAATGRYPCKPLEDDVALPIAQYCVSIGNQYRITPIDKSYELLPKALVALMHSASVRRMLTRELDFLRRLEERYQRDLSLATVDLLAGMRTRLERELFVETMSVVSDED